MLATSTHAFKVNFCKYTNETRSRSRTRRALGQTLHRRAERHRLRRRVRVGARLQRDLPRRRPASAVALPEVPLLGVLPAPAASRAWSTSACSPRSSGRLLHARRGNQRKASRRVGSRRRRSRPPSSPRPSPSARWPRHPPAGEAARSRSPGASRRRRERDGGRARCVSIKTPTRRIADRAVRRRDPGDPPAAASELRSRVDWFPLRAFRELDDALLQLRFNYPEIGLVLLKTRGSLETIADSRRRHRLTARRLVRQRGAPPHERVLKRLDVTAKSFFALVDAGSLLRRVSARARARSGSVVHARRPTASASR